MKKIRYIPTVNSYGLGSWIKDNRQGIIGGLKTAAGIGMLATGIGAPVGAGLIASGVSDIGTEIVSDKQQKELDALNAESQTNIQKQQLINQRLLNNPMIGMSFKTGGNLYPNGGKLSNASRTVLEGYRPSFIKTQGYGDFQKSDYGDLLSSRPLFDPNNPKNIIATENYYKGVPGAVYLKPGDTEGGGRIESYVTEKGDRRFAGSETPTFAKGGGLSRSKDYGSKKKPYPSVKSSDFAGEGRSYPIPTKADAVDALRLAGLHGRSDVRAKVYKKYPGLKKKQTGGYLEETRYNPDLTYYANGGTHESNPNQGIPIGNKGLVEQDEFRYKDYIFTNRY